ncbi:MAG: TonB-dependent receptor [Candidatus Aminicenantes bacterium]|nr:MAG: TonB-dependent receptor [Candidatus Aminicenantes bacterium]
MFKKILGIALAVSIFSFNIYSKEDQKEEKSSSPPLQHDIVVTATRIETPAKEIASSVTVITREDLEQTKKTTLLEALQEVLGVATFQNGPVGGAASVLLRGANSEHTLILMDGVELNDPISPARSFDLAHLTLENVERIEILRGPQSTLYGSDALAGVVNIITKIGEGKPRFHLSSLGGSYDTFQSNAGISGNTRIMAYSLGISYFKSEGLSAASTNYDGNTEKDGYRNFTFSGRLNFHPLKNLDIDFILRISKTKTEIDNFGGAYGDDPNSTQEYDALFLKTQIRSLHLKNRWEQKLGISLVDYDRRHKNLLDTTHPFDSENGLFKSKLFKIDWQNNFFLHESNTLTLGIDHQQEQGESEYRSEGFWGPFSSIFPLKRAHTTGFYLQDQIRISSRFFATTGIRLDKHSQFGTSLTYRLAPAYLIENTGTKFKATLGTGFKSPSLYQLYAPGTSWGPIGNDDLAPEKCIGLDFGFEQEIVDGKILFGATYFQNNYKDLIDFDFSKGYLNIGRAESKGAEFFIITRPLNNLTVKTDYTLTEAKDKDTDTHLLRRPKHKFTASLNYHFIGKGTLNLSFIHVGKREDMDFSTWPSVRVNLSGYSLLNAAISFDITSRIQVFSRLDNIFDQEYEMIKGYGTPRFSAYGGFKIIY